MRTPTNPSGEQAIDLQVRRAERQADRAFQVALESGDGLAALRNAHGHMVELFGGLSRDVETLRTSQKAQHDETIGEIAKLRLSSASAEVDLRASLARLELRLGTRTATSIGEEAMARFIGAEATEKETAAKAALVEVEIRKFKTEQTWDGIRRVSLALTPLLLAIVGLLVAQVNGCSVFPP